MSLNIKWKIAQIFSYSVFKIKHIVSDEVYMRIIFPKMTKLQNIPQPENRDFFFENISNYFDYNSRACYKITGRTLGNLMVSEI
jgi:hypothetical protein